MKTYIMLATMTLTSCCSPAFAGFNTSQEREANLAACANRTQEKAMACLNEIQCKMTRSEALQRILNCDAGFRDGLAECITAHLKGASL